MAMYLSIHYKLTQSFSDVLETSGMMTFGQQDQLPLSLIRLLNPK